MTCRRCQARGQTWDGSPPKCAVREDGFFRADNWNCATMNALRDKADESNPVSSEDQRCAVLPHGGVFIVLGWYKSRGRTELARVVDEAVWDVLDLATAEDFLAGEEKP